MVIGVLAGYVCQLTLACDMLGTTGIGLRTAGAPAKSSHSIALQRLFRFLRIPNVRSSCLATGQLGLDHEKVAPSHHHNHRYPCVILGSRVVKNSVNERLRARLRAIETSDGAR